MPELTNIQTYLKTHPQKFEETKELYKKFLIENNLLNTEIENELATLNWNAEENRFFRCQVVSKQNFLIGDLEIGLIFGVWTENNNGAFNEHWATIDLLVETRMVREAKYFPKSCKELESLVRLMYNYFNETGVYVTDEAQDGAEIDGIRKSDSNKLFQFDYACIPPTLKNLYKILPAYYNSTLNDNLLEIRNTKWWSN